MIRTLIVALLWAWAAHAAEPILRSLEFTGNRHFSPRRLTQWSNLRLGQPVDAQALDRACENLLTGMADEGFYFCQIDSVQQEWLDDSTGINLTFAIREGEQLKLKALELFGDSTAAAGNSWRQSEPGKILSPPRLEEDLWDLLKMNEEAGHGFARLDVQELRLQQEALAIKTRITPGPVIVFSGVRIVGLEHTRPRIVAREARIAPGDIYQLSRIEKAQGRIRRLPYIEEVSDPALISLGADRYELLFHAKEARSNSFDGVIGYQPGGQGQKAQLMGLLDLSFQNLFGTGRKAKIRWERLNQYQQALELFYEEPWVAGWPFSLWGSFRQSILDTLYLTRSLTAGLSWPATEVLTLGGSVFQDETLPDSSGRVSLGLFRSRSRGAALQLDYETRDWIDNPTHGYYYRSYVSAARKDYEAAAPQNNVDAHRFEVDLDWSYRLWGRQVLNLQGHGRVLQSNEDYIPQSDLYRLGGARTLRGYLEDQFYGYTVGWGSLEYRLWIDKVSRIYAFFNQGYYENQPMGALQPEQRWPWGYGVGFRQGTRLGIIGFDFALGEHDVLATAKVHFRLINRF